ncbi:hypothetical protein Q4I30_002394 [Leishmania utingensis]|uniref:Uncharacterized protein n=1 Tax=Leishmania utingensis TaxID=653362 RepID=A0AAW3ASD1_9TRYP
MPSTPLDNTPPTDSRSEATHTLPGTRQAPCVNNSLPTQEKSCGHVRPNTDVYVSEELLDMLSEDRRINRRHHLVVDKVFKAYMLEKKNFAGVMRT